MIIKKLTFKNFKSFGNDSGNQALNNLDILTLIYGENNSGKSNILKFIDLLFKQKVEKEDTYIVKGESLSRPIGNSPFWKGRITNNAFLFHKNLRSTDITFEIELGINISEIEKLEKSSIIIKELAIDKKFFNLKIFGKIVSLSNPYDSEIIIESVFINEKEIYSRQNGTVSRFFKDAVSAALKGDSVTFENLLGLLNECVLFLDHNRFINSENEDNKSKSLNPNTFKNWLHNKSVDQVNYSFYEKFIQFIKDNSISGDSSKVLKNFEPTFSIKENELDVLLKTNSERLPINSFGTGIVQILLILSMIYETNSRIILIEEIELNLSPKAQQDLLKLLTNLIISTKKIDQVIFTSHSDILEDSKDLSIYQVQMLDRGVSKITYLAKPAEEFYETDKKVWNEIASAVRTHGVKGPEWE